MEEGSHYLVISPQLRKEIRERFDKETEIMRDTMFVDYLSLLTPPKLKIDTSKWPTRDQELAMNLLSS